jgi:hypothetical protein
MANAKATGGSLGRQLTFNVERNSTLPERKPSPQSPQFDNRLQVLSARHVEAGQTTKHFGVRAVVHHDLVARDSCSMPLL